MGLFSRLRPDPTAGTPEVVRTQSIGDEKAVDAPVEKTFLPADQSKEIAAHPSEDSDSDDEYVHKDAQRGIQKMEALAQIWPKWALYVTYAL